MLYEIDVSQKEKGIFRRWFQDNYFELIVWYNFAYKKISGFQLCYDRFGDEHALTWHQNSGFEHNRIDNERDPQKYPSTPILVENGYFPAQNILIKFVESCMKIDQNVSKFIIDKIIKFIKSSSPEIDIDKLLSDINQ